MTKKQFIATTLAAFSILTAVPVAEYTLDTNITSVEASAAYSGSITTAEVAAIESFWASYPYTLKRYNNTSSRGRQAVKYLQHLLNVLNNAAIEEDGVIGPASEKAIRAYQASRNLQIDGMVGPESKAKLLSEAYALAASNESSQVTQTAKYSFSNAYAYMKKYWNKKNPSYNYYTNNNCANVVSQAMVAAGVPTTSAWRNGSFAFINVRGLREYFMNTYGVKYIKNPSASDIKPGDIVFTNGTDQHVMFCMKRSGSRVYCSGNTNNRNEISVSTSVITGVLKTSTLLA